MASPLRLFATPKFQISPAVRKVKTCENATRRMKTPLKSVCVNRVRDYSNCKNFSAVKRLDFSDDCVSSFNSGEVTRNAHLKVPEIKINGFYQHNKKGAKCLSINTPEKQILLKSGLQNRNTCQIIGKGGFGTVIKANYKGAIVAVKIIKPTALVNISEVNMLGLEHVNIIKTLDVIFGGNYNHCIIIMEYIENTVALDKVLQDKSATITLETAVKTVKDVSQGLFYLHQNNLIHLDVKPANVLVCADGVCKLCDFGNCLKVGSAQEKCFTHKGTVLYTAPEILLGKTPTFKSDVYSLGIVMWQLITTETPFSEIDKSEILIYKVVKYKLRPDLGKCEKNAYTELFCKCWDADVLVRPEVSVVIETLKQIESLP